jgi:ABC-type branched-subunit amino acid transport system ATPase component
MEICGIEHIANRSVSTLPMGHRRLLELARVLAGGAQFLLLDEPSSGLDDEETEAMGRVITEAVRERGVGVLLVEHDMALVMRICAQIYVLDFGRLIFQGTTTAVQESDLVRAAYLGEESVEAKR